MILKKRDSKSHVDTHHLKRFVDIKMLSTQLFKKLDSPVENKVTLSHKHRREKSSDQT